MAELENNVVTEGDITGEFSESPTIVVSIFASPTDYSNTIVVQNANNASVVSFFPLVGNEPQATQVTQPVTVSQATQATQPATVSQTTSTSTSTGGSSY